MKLDKKFYVGVVEDNKDPNRKGRIKIRVQSLYHTFPLEDIPYAYPFASLSGKEFQIPAIGKLVNVIFLSDDIYSPYYIYSENYNENLQQKLVDLTDDEYVDFTALLFDESTQIYVKGKEFTIDQLLNKITINNSSINLELKDNAEILNLGSKEADQDAVLGTRYFEWMDKFIQEILSPTSIVGNMGAPVLKPKLDKLCTDYLKLRPDFVSNNVKIVDNGEVKTLSRTPDTVNNKNDVNLVLPIDDETVVYKDVYDAIIEQNKKACQAIKNSATITNVPLKSSDTEEEVSNTDNANKANDLHPKIKPYVTRLINKIEAELDTYMVVTSTYRSIAYQQELIDAGNKDAAQPGRSYHNYGLAVDMWPKYNGKLITKKTIDTYPYWDEIAKIAKSLGFRWGSSFGEKWHFDMGFGFKTTELLERYNNNDFVDGYINLGDPTVIAPKDTFNGQEYVPETKTSNINNPCETKVLNASTTSNNSTSSTTTPDSTVDTSGDVISDENEGPVYENDDDLNCQEKGAKLILDQISKGEGTTNKKAKYQDGAETAYDIVFAYGKYSPKKLASGKNAYPISTLTLGEIQEYQNTMVQNQINGGVDPKKASSAVGKYQLIRGTFNEYMAKAGLTKNDIFNKTTQEKLGSQLLINKRGYEKWLYGKITDDEFQLALAKEWASVAQPSNGKSRYGQHVGTSDEAIKDILNQIKNTDCTA